VQVASDLERAGKRRGVRVLTVYGGRAYEPQVEALKRGVEVVVGTPGRLIDLAKQGHLDLSRPGPWCSTRPTRCSTWASCPTSRSSCADPAGRQTMLFSATMPGADRRAGAPLHDPADPHPGDGRRGDERPHRQGDRAVRLPRARHGQGRAALARAAGRDRGLTIIFTRTKRTAAKVADDLVDRGFAAAAIHGDLGQGAREQALRAFRNGKVDVLVATDVAARGIDVENVTHVVNYQCPEDEKTYVHRIGRTGRAGNTGIADHPRGLGRHAPWSSSTRQLDLGIPEPVRRPTPPPSTSTPTWRSGLSESTARS
jgi:superfamily II DNA/RNA helicase